MMKRCGRCGEAVPVENFRKNSKSKDGLASWCTPCFAEYERERYANGDRVRKEANKGKLTQRGKEYVRAHLVEHPCIDCGEDDIVVLDFDHQGDKKYNVSEMFARPLEVIAAEIAKCEVRCANCHRRKTARTLGSWRL